MRRNRRRRASRRSKVVVVALAGAAALGGALAGARPTGTPGIDPLYAAGFSVLLTVACSRASRSTWLVLTAVGVVMSRSWLLLPAFADLGVAFSSAFARRRRRRLGGLVGALGSQVVLRWPHLGFQGLTATVAVVTVIPCLISAYRNLGSRGRHRSHLLVGATAAAVVVLGVPFLVGSLLAQKPISQGIAHTRASLGSDTNAATETASRQLQLASGDFATASSTTASWWTEGTTLIPILAQQHHALARATGAAHNLTRSAQSEEAVTDVRALGYHDGQIDLAKVSALSAPLDRLDRQLAVAQRQLGSLRSRWLIQPIQTRVAAFDAEVAKAHHSASIASQAVAIAPGLLGGNGTRHYFVAFETPSESRGLGGFIGAYGELTASHGRISLTRSGHVSDLNRVPVGARHITGPADYLARYGGFNPQDLFQDLTYSPDLPTVAQVVSQMYPQSGGDPVDGVMVLDPKGLASLLTFTGPISVPGLNIPLSSANAAEELLKTQYVQFGGSGEAEVERHDFLQGALTVAFGKLVTGSLPSPHTIADVLGPSVRQGRILFWSNHRAEQPLLRQIQLAGTFPLPSGGDLLSVTTQNAANNKIDAYLARGLDDQVVYDPGSGSVDATTTITLHNTANAGMAPDITTSYPGSGLAPATNRTWTSVYSPLGLAGATEDGKPLSLSSTPELGVNAYSTFVNIPPGATVTVVMHLEGRVSRSPAYQLSLHEQPLVIPDRVHIQVQAAAGWRLADPGSWNPRIELNPERRFAMAPFS